MLMFHQEFDSALILRNYLHAGNPPGGEFEWLAHLAGLPGGLWLSYLVGGLLAGLVVYGVGLRYTRRVVLAFALADSVELSERWRWPCAVPWAFFGALVGLGLAVSPRGASDGPAGLLVFVLVLLVLGVLALTDWHTGFLPDELTLPLMWAGLVWSWLGYGVGVVQALGGAMAGYVFLFLIFWLYRWLRGREGMGGGDFKFAAALGAWVGLAALPWVLLLACSMGVFTALALSRRPGFTGVFPFGPCLSAAGAVFLWVVSP
ncbi:A24 family peptidase [Pusillimonas sp. T2]|uniref:prepilin peptidase n=1 Tax=Pusillimonas sp. T2 TaxID=1548123 RepID=UPI001303263A|nr:A24 family peptidase [Pusillimonas sp. T2]